MVLTHTTAPNRAQTNGACSAPMQGAGLLAQANATGGETPPRSAPPAPSPLHPSTLHHRVREIAWHIPWYGFKTQARLARDTQVAPSTISRLLRGQELPSLVVALRLAQALGKRSGRALDVGEVFSLDGTYPTTSVCSLMGCPSCVPPFAFDSDDNIVEGFRGIDAGQWLLAPRAKGGR